MKPKYDWCKFTGPTSKNPTWYNEIEVDEARTKHKKGRCPVCNKYLELTMCPSFDGWVRGIPKHKRRLKASEIK